MKKSSSPKKGKKSTAKKKVMRHSRETARPRSKRKPIMRHSREGQSES